MTERINAVELMSLRLPVFTASELVESGQCSGQCLVAAADYCDCRCRGVYHGRLASADLSVLFPSMPVRWPQDTEVKLLYSDGIERIGYVERHGDTHLTVVSRDLGFIHEVPNELLQGTSDA